MTLSDINELLTEAEMCKSAEELMSLFDEAGEDTDCETNVKIFRKLSEKKKPALIIGEETAELNGSVICCPKCRNTSVYTLLGSAAEVLADAEALHFGCCECGTQFNT